MLLGILLGSGDQIRRADAKRDCEHRYGGERGPPLGALDSTDVVAVDAGVKAEALLRDAEFVS